MSFCKTAIIQITDTVPVTKTIEVSWIEGEADTEPATPDGYERAADFDMDYGVAGYLYAYKKIT